MRLRLRLGAYIAALLFLCVLVSPFFTSYHNPRASHIDMAQGMYQTSHEKKYKKYFQYLGFYSPQPQIAFRTLIKTTPEYDNSSTTRSTAIMLSCRAPPLQRTNLS